MRDALERDWWLSLEGRPSETQDWGKSLWEKGTAPIEKNFRIGMEQEEALALWGQGGNPREIS